MNVAVAKQWNNVRGSPFTTVPEGETERTR